MILAHVVGSATGTIKHKSFNGAKLLLCEAIDENRAGKGTYFIASDWVGAGFGDIVMVTTDGSAAEDKHGDPSSPMRNTIMGIIDAVETEVAS